MPILVVVLNKLREMEVSPSEVASKDWCIGDEPIRQLKLYFEEIVVVHIPETACRDLYEKQTAEFRSVMTNLLSRKFKDRKETNLLWSKAHILSEIKRVWNRFF